MTAAHRFPTAIVALTLSGLAWLSSPIPAQAATITDTLVFKGPGKEWCQGNPKFAEAFTIRRTDGNTLTLTQDPLNTGDVATIQATLFTNGIAEIDNLQLTGLAFPKSKAQSMAELILSGANPSNPEHFLTLRGQATFDQTGHLIRVTGTVVAHITSTYPTDKLGNESSPVECVDSVTFVAVKPPPSSGGGGAGTLTVANAPASVGGKFVADGRLTDQIVQGTSAAVSWTEITANGAHVEVVTVGFGVNTGQIVILGLITSDSLGWNCLDSRPPGCAGATVNRSAGTLTLSNTVLTGTVNMSSLITLNGTLTFTPF